MVNSIESRYEYDVMESRDVIDQSTLRRHFPIGSLLATNPQIV